MARGTFQLLFSLSWSFVVLVLISVFLICPTLFAQDQQSPPEEIHYGDFLNREINPSYETDSFFFTADSGDVITLSVTDQSGSYYANVVLELWSPDGDTLALKTADVRARIDFILPEAGIYTIYVRENGGNNVMPYGIDLERMSNPVGIEMGFGENLEGEASGPGEVVLYTFTGCTDDVVSIIATDRSGSFYVTVELELWSPGGDTLVQVVDGSQARIDLTHFKHFGSDFGLYIRATH